MNLDIFFKVCAQTLRTDLLTNGQTYIYHVQW